jgi:hypothetical protein
MSQELQALGAAEREPPAAGAQLEQRDEHERNREQRGEDDVEDPDRDRLDYG